METARGVMQLLVNETRMQYEMNASQSKTKPGTKGPDFLLDLTDR